MYDEDSELQKEYNQRERNRTYEEAKPTDGFGDYRDDVEYCPRCGNQSVVYIHDIQNDMGEWVHYWECQSMDCDFSYET